eukprot:6176456-Pleurochrysis_carterae.AAC.1
MDGSAAPAAFGAMRAAAVPVSELKPESAACARGGCSVDACGRAAAAAKEDGKILKRARGQRRGQRRGRKAWAYATPAGGQSVPLTR